jgi:hypothetical protein
MKERKIADNSKDAKFTEIFINTLFAIGASLDGLPLDDPELIHKTAINNSAVVSALNAFFEIDRRELTSGDKDKLRPLMLTKILKEIQPSMLVDAYRTIGDSETFNKLTQSQKSKNI